MCLLSFALRSSPPKPCHCALGCTKVRIVLILGNQHRNRRTALARFLREHADVPFFDYLPLFCADKDGRRAEELGKFRWEEPYCSNAIPGTVATKWMNDHGGHLTLAGIAYLTPFLCDFVSQHHLWPL